MGSGGVVDGDQERPFLPDYDGACISNLVPALLGPGERPAWLPALVHEASQVLLLVVDGLGWEQLVDHDVETPVLHGMQGSWISSVAPSTTATALTSLTTGLTPGEHGIVGYRMDEAGEVLNVLRWCTPRGDARRTLPPLQLQPVPPFLGHRPPIVVKSEFAGSGFSGAHLEGARHHGWRVPSTLVTECRSLLAAGEPFVYAYYDGVDKVAHEYGLEEHYRAELAFADRLVGDLLSVLPPGAVLLVTADHGQVDVGPKGVRHLPKEVLELVGHQSGEGRFRWLHARRGGAAELLSAATEAHGDEAWIVPVEQVCDERWFGARLTPDARARLGDVALVARSPVSFDDPDDSGPFELVGRHGSLTTAEMKVPLLAGTGS